MPNSFSELRAGVIGSGFIGPVHIEALKRLGVQVVALCGSKNAHRVAERFGIPKVYTNYDAEALIHDCDVDVVHITSPNRYHAESSLASLKAGKHVVCEKPLAMTSRETGSIKRLVAKRKKQIFAVNYNLRFYPAVLQMRQMVQRGDLGEIIHVNGSYFQDWLLKDTDYNWRLLPEEGGPLRAVADIGTHWVDAVSFVMGRRVKRVFAHTDAFHKTRRRPLGEVKTFSKSTKGQRYANYRVATEDFASILLDYDGGAHGNVAVSQVAAGRKNSLKIEIYGSDCSVSFDSERPNELAVGDRDRGDRWLSRGRVGFAEDVAPYIDYPPGHNEGFPDTFKMLYRAVYGDIVEGQSGSCLYATADDGHYEVKFCESVVASAKRRQWVSIR